MIRNATYSAVFFCVSTLSVPIAATAQTFTCEERYEKISDGFYMYNESAARVNAEMDQITLRLKQDGVLDNINHVAPDLLEPDEARDWANSIKEFIGAAQPELQELLEFREFGCANEENEDQLEAMIKAATDQLKISRKRLNGLITIY